MKESCKNCHLFYAKTKNILNVTEKASAREVNKMKSSVLRRRTKALMECVNDTNELFWLSHDLKELGRLIINMSMHMQDLQKKVDAQAEELRRINGVKNNDMR